MSPRRASRGTPGGRPSPPELPIVLDRSDPVPLSVQLATALRDAAVAGRLRDGDRLPATRALAAHLGVSRTVVAAAYDQLHAEGWIEGRHGSGTFVTAAPVTPHPAPPPRPAAGPGAGTASGITLLPGAPWVEGLDRAAWRRAWRAAADAPPLRYPQRDGLPAYRHAVAEHLLRHRGLALPEGRVTETVLATGGTTAALTEIALAVLRPGDLVAVEEPGYPRAVGALRAAGMRVTTVPVDAGGLVVEAVPSRARLVYCTPAHQYPTGGRMPAARRIELVRRARRFGWLVVEDDYDGELRLDVAPLPLLAALGPDVVVHLGTTSKILTPTLGAGWLVGPPHVVSAVSAHRDVTGTGPSPAGQRVLVELLRNGDLARHLRRLRRELTRRRALLVEALTTAGLQVLGDEAGAHVLVPLPSARAEERLVARAARRGLLLDRLARHHAERPVRHGIPLGYAGCGRAELEAAVPVLVELLREEVGTGGRAG